MLGLSPTLFMWIVRVVPANSYAMRILFGALKNLKRIRHVRRARHAGHEALDLGIALQPVLGVLLLLRERPRLVGDLVALDDAFSGGNAAHRAERAYCLCGELHGLRSTQPGTAVRAGAGITASAGRA